MSGGGEGSRDSSDFDNDSGGDEILASGGGKGC